MAFLFGMNEMSSIVYLLKLHFYEFANRIYMAKFSSFGGSFNICFSFNQNIVYFSLKFMYKDWCNLNSRLKVNKWEYVRKKHVWQYWKYYLIIQYVKLFIWCLTASFSLYILVFWPQTIMHFCHLLCYAFSSLKTVICQPWMNKDNSIKWSSQKYS